jgi:hypothetical protein
VGLSAVYLASTIRTFALSLLGIFTPLYIYQILERAGQGPAATMLTHPTGVLLGVVGYYIIHRLTLILVNIPASCFIAETKGGFRKSMLLSNCLHAVNLLLLISSKNQPWLLLPAAVIGGTLIPFYWIPYHLIFVEDGEKEKSFGKKISTVGVLDKAAAVVAPLLGGLVIAFAGFETLLVVVLFLVIASTFPIFSMRHHERHFVPPLKMIFKDFFSKGFRKDLIAFLGAGVENVGGALVWPIFFFGLVGSFAGLGVLTSGLTLISILVTLWLGRVVDKKGKRRVLRVGAYSQSVLWGMRAATQTVPQAFFAQAAARIAAEFLWIPFDTIVYANASAGNPFEYVILREWALNLGRLLMLVLMAFLLLAGLGWLGSFGLAAVGALLTIFMAR